MLKEASFFFGITCYMCQEYIEKILKLCRQIIWISVLYTHSQCCKLLWTNTSIKCQAARIALANGIYELGCLHSLWSHFYPCQSSVHIHSFLHKALLACHGFQQIRISKCIWVFIILLFISSAETFQDVRDTEMTITSTSHSNKTYTF